MCVVGGGAAAAARLVNEKHARARARVRQDEQKAHAHSTRPHLLAGALLDDKLADRRERVGKRLRAGLLLELGADRVLLALADLPAGRVWARVVCVGVWVWVCEGAGQREEGGRDSSGSGR